MCSQCQRREVRLARVRQLYPVAEMTILRQDRSLPAPGLPLPSHGSPISPDPESLWLFGLQTQRFAFHHPLACVHFLYDVVCTSKGVSAILRHIVQLLSFSTRAARYALARLSHARVPSRAFPSIRACPLTHPETTISLPAARPDPALRLQSTPGRPFNPTTDADALVESLSRC